MTNLTTIAGSSTFFSLKLTVINYFINRKKNYLHIEVNTLPKVNELN